MILIDTDLESTTRSEAVCMMLAVGIMRLRFSGTRFCCKAILRPFMISSR